MFWIFKCLKLCVSLPGPGLNLGRVARCLALNQSSFFTQFISQDFNNMLVNVHLMYDGTYTINMGAIYIWRNSIKCRLPAALIKPGLEPGRSLINILHIRIGEYLPSLNISMKSNLFLASWNNFSLVPVSGHPAGSSSRQELEVFMINLSSRGW